MMHCCLHLSLKCCWIALFIHGQVVGKPSAQMQFFKSEYLADLSIALASKPVVALIDGDSSMCL